MEDAKAPEQDFFTTDDSSNDTQPSQAQEPITWTASEFLYHQKSFSWYLYASLALLGAATVLYLFSRDLIGPISILILGGLLMFGASRKPRTVEYRVDEGGIMVGTKLYSYGDFQSFSISQEDQIESFSLLPAKRFMPSVSLYLPPEEGQRVFDLLGLFLPFEQREKDGIDKFLHRIKF